MKKSIVLFLILVIVLPAFASSGFGSGLSVLGNTAGDTEVHVNVSYTPYDFEYFNPFLRFEGGCAFNREHFGLSAIDVYVGFEIIKSSWNPLAFITTNYSKYSPSIGAGTAVRNNQMSLYAEVSPFRVIEKDMESEFLTVGYEYYPASKSSVFDVYLFRFTYLY